MKHEYCVIVICGLAHWALAQMILTVHPVTVCTSVLVIIQYSTVLKRRAAKLRELLELAGVTNGTRNTNEARLIGTTSQLSTFLVRHVRFLTIGRVFFKNSAGTSLPRVQ